MAIIRGELVNPSQNEWLHDTGELYVQIRLCQSQSVRESKANAGKNEPIMLKNVIQPSTGRGFPNAIICDAGSVIEFIIKSKGPRGFGYTVRSGFEPIADALYYCDTSDNPSANPQILTLPYFWTSKKKQYAIKVDDWATLGVTDNKELRERYWECKIITWPIFGFKKGDKYFGSPRGGIAEADVKGAGVHSGDQVTEAPGTVSSISQPANPEQENNGFLSMNFFIFKDAGAKHAFYETYLKGKSEDFA